MPDNPCSPEVLSALKQEILASLHCAMPGIVESYDAETQTASVRPALRSRVGREVIQLPLLTDVPVFMLGSERNNWTVSAGDSCLLIFSDAFAFVGFRPRHQGKE